MKGEPFRRNSFLAGAEQSIGSPEGTSEGDQNRSVSWLSQRDVGDAGESTRDVR